MVEVRWPEGPWARAPRVLLADKRLPPALKVVVLALWNRSGTIKELAERFGLTPQRVWEVLTLLKGAGLCGTERGRGKTMIWTLTPEAYEALMRNPTAFVELLAPLVDKGGAASLFAGGRGDGPECRSGLDEAAVAPGASLERSKERGTSEDAAAGAASSRSRSQLEEQRRELQQQLEEARKPASERLRRHILAYCRVNGGPAGNVLAAAVHVYWEEVNTATARRFKALLKVRLPAMVREVAAAPDAPRQHKIARFLVGNAMAEAREDARTEIESLRVRLERAVWELEAQTEAAQVRVSGAAGWYEEAEGRRVLTVTERVEVGARAAWVPPGREPVEVGRPAFFEARRELLLARLGAEASPPARVPEEARPTAARGEEAVPEDRLEGLVRGLFQLRDLILNPPNLPAGGWS
ncbi:MAG: hypothetical protein QXY39_08465 [Thermofilaceae archaeon]